MFSLYTYIHVYSSHIDTIYLVSTNVRNGDMSAHRSLYPRETRGGYYIYSCSLMLPPLLYICICVSNLVAITLGCDPMLYKYLQVNLYICICVVDIINKNKKKKYAQLTENIFAFAVLRYLSELFMIRFIIFYVLILYFDWGILE